MVHHHHVTTKPRQRHVCVLLLPGECEAARWAPVNDMDLETFWQAVVSVYEAALRAFGDSSDVVQVCCPDAGRLSQMSRRVADEFRVVYVRALGPVATDPSIKLFVWCHTPVLQRCQVAVRVHLERIRACPRVTLVQ